MNKGSPRSKMSLILLFYLFSTFGVEIFACRRNYLHHHPLQGEELPLLPGQFLDVLMYIFIYIYNKSKAQGYGFSFLQQLLYFNQGLSGRLPAKGKLVCQTSLQ